MSEGIAIIIAASIGVIGILISLFINYLMRELDFKDKIFFEAYQKRLSIYEEVIHELQNMVELNSQKILETTTIDLSDKILNNIHSIDTLIARLNLFGSKISTVPLIMAREPLLKCHAKCTSEPLNVEVRNYVSVEIFSIIKKMNNTFITLVSEETSSNFVDEKINKIHKKFTRKKSNKK